MNGYTNIRKLFNNVKVCFLQVSSKEEATRIIRGMHAYASFLKEKIKCSCGIFTESEGLTTEILVKVELVTDGENLKYKNKSIKDINKGRIKKLFKMKAMRDEGYSFGQIAKLFGISRQAVQQILKYYEVDKK